MTKGHKVNDDDKENMNPNASALALLQGEEEEKKRMEEFKGRKRPKRLSYECKICDISFKNKKAK